MKKFICIAVALALFTGCSNSRDKEREEARKEWEKEKAERRAEEKRAAEKAAADKAERTKTACAAAPYYGTTVPFINTLDEACEKATKENKLVFLLHLSGDFKNNDFT